MKIWFALNKPYHQRCQQKIEGLEHSVDKMMIA